MAIDNLNFYSAGLPAGQLTDRYSSKPGCLRSKNLDIFSSSKSVKATAWSEATTVGNDIIKQDGDLILKTDGKVYQLVDGSPTLLVDPSTNFPVYQVSYEGKNATYSNAQWGTVKDMVVKYEGDTWKSFVVFTDKASYTYSKAPYIAEKTLEQSDNLTALDGPTSHGYPFQKNVNTGTRSTITVKMPNVNFATVPIYVYASQNSNSDTDITLDSITWYKKKYYYDPQSDSMVPDLDELTTLTVPATDIKTQPVLIEIPASPYNYDTQVMLNFRYTKKTADSTYGWSGTLYVDINKPGEAHRITGYTDGDYNDYYSYLSIDDNRHLVEVGEYYWMPSLSFQTLYTWNDTRTEITNRKKVERYDFVAYMGWESDVSMDVIGMVIWNEAVYMIGNMSGNGYIIPCDLSGGRGTPYIAYGCAFKGATNIDYLLYLVGEDRGISTLWVFNNQELVPVIGGKHEVQYNDIVGVEEQYKFDGKILNWRKNLILTTIDNRIFQYGQTYGGKGGTFIHELPQNATITGLRTSGNNLEVAYSITEGQTTTNYVITYQDDTPMKNYNIEWEATYPIVIGNHLLEKEESDLYVSYILPSEDTSLEFWGMANHYHFWTFKTNGQTIPEAGTKWYIDGSDGMYMLDFVEANGEYLTFKLEGDLPLMTGDETMRIRDYLAPVGQPHTYIAYSEFNHFRKIGEITTENYQEGEFRFHNLNNKLELPKSYSLQIMVKGKGNNDYTPELFAIDLVANQRDRG